MMPIRPEMGSAHPHWFGYVSVDDVDASVACDRGCRREGGDARNGH
jgi:hypothetical protein